jgi:hypothetical protein
MPHLVLRELVDIYEPPIMHRLSEDKAKRQITIGDLHGNAIKLMFTLMTHGIATNISETEYATLVSIYRMPIHNLKKDHLDTFKNILVNITFNTDYVIRLLGDELADRGQNDYFTLKILEKLHEHRVPMEILISNHSIEFLEAYEKQDIFHSSLFFQRQHAPSIENLELLIKKGIVARDEILAIVEQHYKPMLLAIGYFLDDNNHEITIYSHAAIGLNTLRSLAQKLTVDYNEETAHSLANTINNINRQFQYHVTHNTVHTLYSREIILNAYRSRCDLSDAPLECIMWNRRYDQIIRPAVYLSYAINFVHGHDDKDPGGYHICNLDTSLGKSEQHHQALYTPMYSWATQMKPNPTLLSQLNAIKMKELELRTNGYRVAADHAKNLYDLITDKHQAFLAEAIDTQTFKTHCLAAIEAARPELERHRGWKQLLGNLALAVLGVGVLYVMAGLINQAVTGKFLFFKTDSAHKIDQLEQFVKNVYTV